MDNTKKKELVSYIKETIDILDTYDLEDVKKKINKSLIEEKLNVSYDNEIFGNLLNINKTNVFDLSLDFKENEKRFKLWVNQNFGSQKTFYDYYHCQQIFKWYYFRLKGENYYCSFGKINFGFFFDFMYFIVKNEKHENLAQGNELADKYRQINSYKNFWKGCEIKELNNIYVKFYKNGRIDIKGLTENQKFKIEYLYELSKKRLKYPNRDY